MFCECQLNSFLFSWSYIFMIMLLFLCCLMILKNFELSMSRLVISCDRGIGRLQICVKKRRMDSIFSLLICTDGLIMLYDAS